LTSALHEATFDLSWKLSLNNINMKKTINPALGLAGIAIAFLIVLQVSCAPDAEVKTDPQPGKKELTQTELVARGQYVVTIGGCNDCHSPKIFGPQGFHFDSSRLLSGHPAADPLPPIDLKALQPGNWMLFGPDLTSAVGPWGISYSANLTPDSATGLGAWDEASFIRAMRTGKHMGQETGRPILPPMPWPEVAKMTDEDLKATFAFLRTLKPISNRVPNPVPPNEVAAMSK
jgi:hypothetical protein